jgi:hypothetical protein
MYYSFYKLIFYIFSGISYNCIIFQVNKTVGQKAYLLGSMDELASDLSRFYYMPNPLNIILRTMWLPCLQLDYINLVKLYNIEINRNVTN